MGSGLGSQAKLSRPEDAGFSSERLGRITQFFPDGSSDEGLYSFAAGQDANGGAASFSDQFIFVPNPSCLPAQGVWQRTGDKTFIGTHEGFCYDAANGYAPAGKVKFRYSLTLGDTSLSGRLHIDGIDPNGNVVFSADGLLRGVRMRAEAP